MASSMISQVNLRPLRMKVSKRGDGVKLQSDVPGSDPEHESDSEHELEHEHEHDVELEFEPEPVTPAGRVFVHPMLNVHILVTLGFKTPCNLDDFKDGVRRTILKHKRFSSVMRRSDKGELYWVPTTVDLDDHIKVIYPDDKDADSPTIVEDYVAKLMQAPPLDMSKPLFEFHIVKAKMGEAAENVVFRVHHSLGDGTSLMSLLLACTRRVDNPDLMPTLPTFVRRKNTNKTNFWQIFFLIIWRFLLILWYSLLDIIHFTATIIWLEDSKSPIKGYPGVEMSPRRVAHTTVSLDDIRVVKKAMHGTVNDVTFGMLLAGLALYLKEESDYTVIESDKLFKPGFIGNENGTCTALDDKKTHALRIRACVLVNTRPSPGLQEIQDMMRGGSQARWGNEMGYVILPLPISKYEDSLGHLHKAKKIMDQKKLSWGPVFSYKSGKLLMSLTGVEWPAKLTYRCVSHTTMAFSNVPGPSEEVQFFGHTITHIIPTVSGQPQSLCVHIQSYKGMATIIISTAKDIISQPEKLCKYMACALEDMKQKVTSAGMLSGN